MSKETLHIKLPDGRSWVRTFFFELGWTHARSKLPATKENSICEKETCTNMRLERMRGRNQDAIRPASNGPIPTRAPLELHPTAHV